MDDASFMKVISKSPVNIALIKYWGKKDEEKVLPYTTSLSLTLTDLYTETTIEKGPFSFILNGNKATEEELLRVKDVLVHFKNSDVVITSNNNFPTAAGLASSASGLAALTVGLNQFFSAGLSLQELAYLTRLGSGSACRSLVDGFGVWDTRGQVKSIANPWEDLMMIIVVISKEKKAISSRDAMKITVETSPLYQAWIDDSFADLDMMMKAIEEVNFTKLGEVMEINSFRLHEVMRSSQPSIVYQTKDSLEVIDLVRTARKNGLEGYSTMDAGSNVKILMKKHQLKDWISFLSARCKFPLLTSRIGGHAHAE
jgi:diphosphomevalonate decarboxylase